MTRAGIEPARLLGLQPRALPTELPGPFYSLKKSGFWPDPFLVHVVTGSQAELEFGDLLWDIINCCKPDILVLLLCIIYVVGLYFTPKKILQGYAKPVFSASSVRAWSVFMDMGFWRVRVRGKSLGRACSRCVGTAPEMMMTGVLEILGVFLILLRIERPFFPWRAMSMMASRNGCFWSASVASL